MRSRLKYRVVGVFGKDSCWKQSVMAADENRW